MQSFDSPDQYCYCPQSGIDADFSYMETLANDNGLSGARIRAFKALQARIQSKCAADFSVNECAIQSMRKASGSYPATCEGHCAEFASVDSDDACLTSGELPQSLWKHQYRPGTRRKKCKTVNVEYHENGARKLFNESSCRDYHAWEQVGGQTVEGLTACTASGTRSVSLLTSGDACVALFPLAFTPMRASVCTCTE